MGRHDWESYYPVRLFGGLLLYIHPGFSFGWSTVPILKNKYK